MPQTDKTNISSVNVKKIYAWGENYTFVPKNASFPNIQYKIYINFIYLYIFIYIY